MKRAIKFDRVLLLVIIFLCLLVYVSGTRDTGKLVFSCLAIYCFGVAVGNFYHGSKATSEHEFNSYAGRFRGYLGLGLLFLILIWTHQYFR